MACASDDPMAASVRGRLLARDAGSEVALARMVELIGLHDPNCLCRDGTNSLDIAPRLPTRVLDLDTDVEDTIRLVLTEGKCGHFISLSHCWGTTVRFTTTTTTLGSHIAGIKVASLPKSFRDAITVTRKLGIRFLWIDSLCIIQDDLNDWQHESPKMASYYGDSYVTIAADRSSDDADGFLSFRGSTTDAHNQYPTAPCYEDQAKLFVFHSKGEDHRLYLQKILIHGYSDYTTDKDPGESEALQRRAWTLQERYLSKRIFHFGSTQNYLEKTDTSPTKGIIFEDGQYVDRSAYVDHLCTPDAPLNLQFHSWYHMVSEFTRRRLTYRSDILPAISGLARAIQGLTKEQYCAGLWKGDIAHGLLWVRNTSQSSAMSSTVQGRVDEYIAPSWSWASAQGPIGFLLNDLENKVDPDTWANGHDHDGNDSFISLVRETTDYIFQLDGEDPFGRLVDASLTLQVPVLAINRLEYRVDERIYPREECPHVLLEAHGQQHVMPALLDDLEVQNQIIAGTSKPLLFAIPIAYTEGPPFCSTEILFKDCRGLIVEDLGKTPITHFRRIGTFSSGKPLCFQDSDYQRVTLL